MTAAVLGLALALGSEPSLEVRLRGEGAVDVVPEPEGGLARSASAGGYSERVGELRGEVFVRARSQLAPSVSVAASVFVSGSHSHQGAPNGHQYLGWNGTGGRSVVEERVGELAARLTLGNLHAVVGKQFIRWGASPLFSPVDVVNPVNLAEGPAVLRSADPDAPYLPVWGARLSIEPGPMLIEGVWVPVFAPDRVDLVRGDWALLAGERGSGLAAALRELETAVPPALWQRLGADTLVRRPPGLSLANGQAGLRVGVRRESWQASANYFFGYEHYPQVIVNTGIANPLIAYFEKDPSLRDPRIDFDEVLVRLDAGESLFDGSYRRRQSWGVSAETSRRAWHIALDAAYSPRATVYARSGRAADASLTAAAASASYWPYQTAVAWLGLHGTMIGLRGPTAQLAFGWDERVLAADVGVRTTFRDVWRVQVMAVTEIERSSYYGTLSVGYAINENIDAFAGIDIVGGRRGTLGGQFEGNDQGFLGIRAIY